MDTKHCARCLEERPLADFIFEGRRQRQLCRICLEGDAAAQATKTCTKCQEEQPVRQFSRSKSGQRQTWCRTCARAYRRALKKTAPRLTPQEKTCKVCQTLFSPEEFYRKPDSPDGLMHVCKTCHKNRCQTSRTKIIAQASWGPIAAHTATTWMSKYHLTYDQLRELLSKTECEVCGVVFGPDVEGKIDHHHGTGQVRGVLCLHCNLLLGHAKDQPAVLKKAVLYLERNPPREEPELDATTAQAILDRVASGERQKDLATEFGLNPSSLSDLVSGKSWPQLDRPEKRPTGRRSKRLPEDIKTILDRLAAGETPSAISRDYGVTRQAISNIQKGSAWADVPRPPKRIPRAKVWE